MISNQAEVTDSDVLMSDKPQTTEAPLHILLVEDQPSDVEQVAREIHKLLATAVLHTVETRDQFNSSLETSQPDLILVSDSIAGLDGMSALKLARERLPDVPFIMLSGSVAAADDEAGVVFIKAGVWEYVRKEYIGRLGVAVLNVLARQREKVAHQATIAALKESESRLRMIVENTSSLVGVLDKDAVYQYASPSHESAMGFSPGDLIGKSGFDFIHPEEVDRFLDLWNQGVLGKLDTINGLRYQGFDKDGGQHFLQATINVTRDSAGNIENIIYIGDDITPSIQAEEALRQEREKFRTLVEEAPLGVSLVDADGNFTYINPRFQEMFGYTLEDIPTGKHWFRTAYPDREYRHEVISGWLDDVRKARAGEAPPRRYRITCKDGTQRIVIFFSQVMETGEQLAICQDVTEQDGLEIRFMHAQKMESIGRLASGVAHDFNNLLTSILGNADFVLMDLKPEDPHYEIVEEIKMAAEKAAALTRQLLTFSRKQKCIPETIDLNVRIKETEKMLRRLIGEDIDLELLLADGLNSIEIDPGHLEQIIMNLAVNARDAMPDGGRFTIETARVDLDENYSMSPADLTPGPYAVISVSDTGVGMPLEVRQRIFDPFFTTKDQGKGTGLGLSTVYGIVQQNFGDIHVYSTPGQGSTFKLYFPMVIRDTSSEPAVAPAVDDTAKLRGQETILVVEDEEKVRSVVRMMLKKYGYHVLVAEDGETAQRVYQKHGRPVDLLLTDMVMPGMTGMEVAKHFRTIQPDVKVICMSGYTDMIIHKDMQEEGFVFLHKPFTPESLAREVKALLDK